MLFNNNNNSSYLPLPTKVKYFKAEIINEILEIPSKNPDIQQLLETILSVHVEYIKLIRTEKGISNEGQKLTGYKLLVKLWISKKVMYVANHQSICEVHCEDVKSFFVTLPGKIEDKDIRELLKYNKLIATPYVECVEARMLDARHIHICIMLLIDVRKVLLIKGDKEIV